MLHFGSRHCGPLLFGTCSLCLCSLLTVWHCIVLAEYPKLLEISIGAEDSIEWKDSVFLGCSVFPLRVQSRCLDFFPIFMKNSQKCRYVEILWNQNTLEQHFALFLMGQERCIVLVYSKYCSFETACKFCKTLLTHIFHIVMYE